MIRATLGWIPPGDLGTRDTLHRMKNLARDAAWRLPVRTTAVNIIAEAHATDPEARLRAIRAWLVRHTRFLPDPDGVELLHDPGILLTEIATRGIVYVDCDDVAMLAAALGLSIGCRAIFQAVGYPGQPFTHVFTELGTPDGSAWLDCDVTREAQPGIVARMTRTLTIEV